MITATGRDHAGLVLTPEISPNLVLQEGPYDHQIQVKFPGETPVGGPELPNLPPALNFDAGGRPAQALEP